MSVVSTGYEPARRRRSHLGDEAAAYVRELIMSGQLPSGSFIRPESVAAALEISATPAREGLLTLRGEGFLQLEPRRGFVVATLTRRDIDDIFSVQAWLAGELTARAAQNATEDDVATLTDLQAELTAAVTRGSFDEAEEFNFRFHRLLNSVASAPKMAWFLGVAVRYVPSRFYDSIPGWSAASVRDHQMILEALRAKDPEAARTAMAAHIEHAGNLLSAHYEERSGQADAGPVDLPALPRGRQGGYAPLG